MAVNILRLLQKARFLSTRRRLALYPPMLFMGVRILELDDNWERVRLRLPLTMFSRNAGGGMFGGYQAAIADPIAALACVKQFPGYEVWTRSLTVEFERPGNSHLELRFDFDPAIKAQIRADLSKKNRSTPEFDYALYREDGLLASRIRCRVAIRPGGYRKTA